VSSSSKKHQKTLKTLRVNSYFPFLRGARKKLNPGVRVRGVINVLELEKVKLAIFQKTQELGKFKLAIFQKNKCWQSSS
jgi:hypothetical protein